MRNAAAATRRIVRYENLDAFLFDAESLGRGRFRTVGNWTYPQILDHLARTMHCSFDGFGFKAPWIVRLLIAPILKNGFLTRPMKPGLKLPAKMAAVMMPGSDVSL